MPFFFAVLAHGHWLKKEHSFCISKVADLECDRDSTIVVQSALYSQKRKKSDPRTNEECAPLSSAEGERSNNPSYTTEIRSLCNGHRYCKIEPKKHKVCEDKPFTFMTVIYKCEAGPPSEEMVQEVQTKTAMALAVGKSLFNSIKAKAGYADDTPEDEKVEDKSDTPVVVQASREDSILAALDEQWRRHEKISMVPCYRLDRATLIYRNYHDWNGRLTKCGEYEGCFKLKWYHPRKFPGVEPERRYFSDEQNKPYMEELLEGVLSTEGDSILVTFNGIGIQRNDYWTWGICLPKTQAMEYAINLWSKLKESK